MSERHTPGRLSYRETRVYFANVAGGFDIRACPDAVANARRIVACWNACEQFSTDDLERKEFGKLIAEWAVRLGETTALLREWHDLGIVLRDDGVPVDWPHLLAKTDALLARFK